MELDCRRERERERDRETPGRWSRERERRETEAPGRWVRPPTPLLYIYIVPPPWKPTLPCSNSPHSPKFGSPAARRIEEMPSTTNRSGEGNKPSTSTYPCVRRLRHRRLLNCLWAEGFEAAFTSMAGETDACFSVRHLRRLVERSQWKDAVEYLCRFVPPELGRLGLEAQVLHRFLVAHMALSHIIAGTKEGDALAAKYGVYRSHGSSVMHGVIRLRSIMLTALHAKQQLRTSLDWERVRRKASEIVNRLAYRIPELKGMVLMPTGLFNNVVLPISFSPHRKHHGKKQFRRLPASTLAKSYLRKRSLLPSSHSQGPRDELLNKALNWVSDIVDESLKAGKRPESHQENPLQPSVTKDATAAPISQAMFRTLAVPLINPGTLPASSAGVSVAPVSQTMIGPFSCAAKTTGMASWTNAGANVAPVSQAVFGTTAGPVMNPRMPSEANAGAFPSVCPTTVSTFAGPGMLYAVNAMTNAGQFASNAPTTAASSLGTVFGCLTKPDKGSGMSLMADATWAGTNKHWSQGCNAESSQQGLTLQNDRRVLTTYDEQGRHPKRQRAAGTSGEASLMSGIQT